MKTFITILCAICFATGNLSADANGRDKCPCDDYSNAIAQVDPYGQVYYDSYPEDQYYAPTAGTDTGYNLAVLGVGALLIGAIVAAIVLSDSDGHHGH